MLSRTLVDEETDSYLDLVQCFTAILTNYEKPTFWGPVSEELKIVPSDIAASIFLNPAVKGLFAKPISEEESVTASTIITVSDVFDG